MTPTVSSFSMSSYSLVLAVLLAACSSGSNSGNEGGACYPNGTCNAGLTCFSKLCVNTHPDGSTDGNHDSSTADVPAAETSAVDARKDQAGTGGETNDGATSSDVATSETNADVTTSEAGVDAGPFDPSQLAGLALWLEADKGVMLSDAGTYIAGWVDQSPAHHVAQAIEQPPTLMTAAIGAHPGMDMRSPVLMAVGGLNAGTGPILIEMVVTDVPSAAGLYSSTSTKASLGISVSTGDVSASESQPGMSTVTVPTSKSITTGPHLVGAQIDATGTLSVRVDGALANSQTGATLDLSVTGSYFGQAVFAEIVAVVGPITPTQVTTLEGYLSTKYGL